MINNDNKCQNAGFGHFWTANFPKWQPQNFGQILIKKNSRLTRKVAKPRGDPTRPKNIQELSKIVSKKYQKIKKMNILEKKNKNIKI